MILISHRGNVNGKNPERENSPDYILEAMKSGYNVEIDVWYKNNCLYLGHDKPEYKINISFLNNDKLWCHCKNPEALAKLINPRPPQEIHCFFHKTDDVTLTSKGYMWGFPKKRILKGSICVLPEVAQYKKEDIQQCVGICSDYIENYEDF